jgi:hypothetical protein
VIRPALLALVLAACGGPSIQTTAHESGAGLSMREQPQVSAELQGRTVVFRVDDYTRGCGPEPIFEISPVLDAWIIQETEAAGVSGSKACRYAVKIRVLGLPVGEHVVFLRRADGTDFSRTVVTIP